MQLTDRGLDMAQVSYSTDAAILNADTDNWQEELRLARQQREQRGWELIAIFPQSAERVKGLGLLLNKPVVVVILLFQRSQLEKTIEAAKNKKATRSWGVRHQIMNSG
jgi:hypothetical protein